MSHFKTTAHDVKVPDFNDVEFSELEQGSVFTWPESVFWYLKLNNGMYLALGSGQARSEEWMVSRAPGRVILARRVEIAVYMEEPDEVSNG